jgi:gas vesicle protein
MRRALIFLAGLLAGGSLGAGISVLFAPASGDELRQNLKQRFENVKAKSADAAAQREAALRAELAELTGQAPPAT